MISTNNLIIAIIAIIAVGCSNIQDIEHPNQNIEKCNKHLPSLSATEATEIAELILNKTRTRTIKNLKPTIEYVVNATSTTRSDSNVDTLAYVLNYPDDAGFAIIASSKNVYPILAFSPYGNFSFNNEGAINNFINNLNNYIKNADYSTEYTITEESLDGCYSISPQFQTSLSQDAPWNKYVTKGYPGCKVGCVAVATALTMANSRLTIKYHDKIYYLNAIMKAIHSHQQGQLSENSTKKIVGVNPTQPTYTYEQAEDIMAALLYQLGLDMGMKYGKNASSTNSINAYNLCLSLNLPVIPNDKYNPITTTLPSFDYTTVMQLIRDNHIIYLRGVADFSATGHAWVGDGGYFCVDPSDRNKIIEYYIHCDWGFGGAGNGYYSGSVFSYEDTDYRLMGYFAMKKTF